MSEQFCVAKLEAADTAHRKHAYSQAPAASSRYVALTVFAIACGVSRCWLSLTAQPAAQPASGASSGSKNSMQHYILGHVTDADVPSINVFLQSWNRYAPTSQLLLWAAHNTTLPLHGLPVEVRRFEPSNQAGLQRLELWLLYLQGLQRQGGQAGIVLSTVADVVVQSDPWVDWQTQLVLIENAVLFPLEGGPDDGQGRLISQYDGVMSALQRCFGAEAARALGSKPLASADVVTGSLKAVLAFLQQVLDVAQAKAAPECSESTGADLAVLNYLLHHDSSKRDSLRFKAQLPRNWQSPIHSAAHGWPFRIDRFGVLRRDNGSTPAIVRQYGRWRGVQGFYHSMYPYLGKGFFYHHPNSSANSLISHMRHLCSFCHHEQAEQQGPSKPNFR